MKVLKTAQNKVLLRSGSAIQSPPNPRMELNTSSGGISALRAITGGLSALIAPSLNTRAWGFTATTAPKIMLTNTATSYVFGFANGIAPSAVTVTFLSGASSVASYSNLVIGSTSFSFDITCTAEQTVSFTVTAVFGSNSQTMQYSFTAYHVIPATSYEVQAVEGATYGFELNSDEYYESKNYHVASSYAMCKIVITCYVGDTDSLYLDCINYGESGYDFGILSTFDNMLSMSNTADSSNVKKSFSGSSSASVQTVSYGLIPDGQHYICVKYRKDGGGDTGNDTLQFKVRIES